MKRPWQVWLVFAACICGAAMAMLWLTQEALESDRLRRTAQANAELEQRVSLALWRMDTELAPIIAEEVVRPPSAYRATVLVDSDPSLQQGPPPSRWPQQAAQPAMSQQAATEQSAEQAVSQQQEVPTPQMQERANSAASQNGVEPPAYVLLQFEVLPDGTWQSPQVPERGPPAAMQTARPADPTVEERARLLEELPATIDVAQLLAELPTTSIPSLAEVGSHLLAQRGGNNSHGGPDPEQLQFLEGNRSNPAPPVAYEVKSAPLAAKVAQGSKEADFERRTLRYQSLAGQSLFNSQRAQNASNLAQSVGDPFGDENPNSNAVEVGVSRPLWFGERLLLARRVAMQGQTVIQGAWLDWVRLKTRLLNEAADVLPAADLLPIREAVAVDPSRTLAGLPVRLVVQPAAVTAMVSPSLRWALWMGWGALALAAAAAAALLHGVMTLSERRAAFASSVTHELRTPLTTFRMYAEMLARGMVPDAAKRQDYLQTLQREAERLTLLVENVLAYARLERGRRPETSERISVDAFLQRVRPRLAHRAEEAGMQCVFQLDDQTGRTEIATDANVVEQILFNLVDNAAKYARTAADRRIHVEADHDASWIALSVRDHGPGMPARLQSRKLRAFFKTAEQSAESAPGVGLGLNLCRRLARQLGGRLEFDTPPEGGTIVSLILPVA
jgi:signal transduction histidine kinase